MFVFLKSHSLPVHQDETCDEKGHSYGEEVCERHIIREASRHAVQCGAIGHREILPSIIIIPAAPLQGEVRVVSIVHDRV